MRHLIAASGAVAALAIACAAQAQPHVEPQGQQTPRAFLFSAIQGDNAEIRLGRLAQGRGATPRVRNFGHVLEQDHADARRRAASVAHVMGMTAPTTVTPDAQNEYARLHSLRGRAFDQEFATYMVQDHQKDIADFQAQASGRGPVATLARNSLPTLQRHLDMAQRIETSSRR
jgi:putative membrane protein